MAEKRAVRLARLECAAARLSHRAREPISRTRRCRHPWSAQRAPGRLVADPGRPQLGRRRQSDLLGVDPSITEGGRQQPRPVLMRSVPNESLSRPAWWPDGSAFVFQREEKAAPAVNSPDGFARPPARIELAAAGGSNRRVLITAAWQPSPSPNGSEVAFVRFTDRGASLLTLSSADGSVHVLVDVGRFPEIFSPRFSPDGTRIAFGARSYDDLQAMGLAGLLSSVGPRSGDFCFPS